MRNNRRAFFLLSGVAALAIVAADRPAYALFGVGDIVFDPSSYQQQLIDYALKAKEYATQLQQQVTQLMQLKNMIQNTLSLPIQVYAQAQQLMAGVQSITQAGSLLTGNSGSILTRLNSLSGYTNYLSSLGTNLENAPQMFASWQQQLGQSFSTLGNTFGVQQKDLTSQAALLQAAQSQAASSGGQLQAIQAVAQIGANNAATMQQVEQTLIASAQATAQYQEVQSDRSALEDAALQKMVNGTQLPTTGNDIRLP